MPAHQATFKKSSLMIALCICCAFISAPSFAQSTAKHDFTVTDSFLVYMKAVMNPHKYGFRDNKFFPYSTRYGRRIGWGLPVSNKSYYVNGQTMADADAELLRSIQLILPSLDSFLRKNYPAFPFGQLSEEAQQILVDRAFTEGVNNLPSEFCKAVVRNDWATLLNNYLYIRNPDGWLDVFRNSAFAQRWIQGKTGKALVVK
jgi:hypothetical protein